LKAKIPKTPLAASFSAKTQNPPKQSVPSFELSFSFPSFSRQPNRAFNKGKRERFDEAGSGDGGVQQDAKISGGGGR
jgi:hypothetical protein